MKCWAWIDSGECVDAENHEEALALLRQSNPTCLVRSEDVLDLLEMEEAGFFAYAHQGI